MAGLQLTYPKLARKATTVNMANAAVILPAIFRGLENREIPRHSNSILCTHPYIYPPGVIALKQIILLFYTRSKHRQHTYISSRHVPRGIGRIERYFSLLLHISFASSTLISPSIHFRLGLPIPGVTEGYADTCILTLGGKRHFRKVSFLYWPYRKSNTKHSVWAS